MMCPKCNSNKTFVVDSREAPKNSIRRRRECKSCGERFSSYEHIEAPKGMYEDYLIVVSTENKAQNHYVYFLIDPRDNEVFYIGKGSGTRVYVHEKMVLSGEYNGNPKTAQVIKEIHKAKKRVIHHIADFFEFESDAYRAEANKIIELSSGKLTNYVHNDQQVDTILQ